MKFKPNLSLEFIALAILALSGCESCDDRTLPPPGPKDAAERFARAACKAEVDCGCGLYPAMEVCESELVAKFEDALANGATIDEDCFEQFLESELLQGCPPLPLTPDAVPECVAMVGSGAQGDPCLPFSLLTMLPGQGCQAGLFCSANGICGDDDQPPKQAGDPCDPAFALSCGVELYCSNTGICEQRVSEGQSCNDPLACEPGWFCDGLTNGAGVCTPQLAVGETCEPDEVGSCAGLSRCYAATLQCDDMTPFLCVNLGLP